MFLFTVVVYTVEVYTGEQQQSACTSRVSILMSGEIGDSGKRRLYQSSEGNTPFNTESVRETISTTINKISYLIYPIFFWAGSEILELNLQASLLVTKLNGIHRYSILLWLCVILIDKGFWKYYPTFLKDWNGELLIFIQSYVLTHIHSHWLFKSH